MVFLLLRAAGNLDAKRKELQELQTRESVSREELLRSHKERKRQLEKQVKERYSARTRVSCCSGSRLASKGVAGED